MSVSNNKKMKPGPGRKKGIPNKITASIREMIETALNNKGGVKYFEKQADANPVAFMALVAKIMPNQLTLNENGLPSIAIAFVSSSTNKLDTNTLDNQDTINDKENDIC